MRSRPRKIPLLLFALYGVASLSGVSFETDTRKIDPYIHISMGTDLLESRLRTMAAPSGTSPLLLPAFLSLGSGDPAIPVKIMNLEGTSLRISDRLFIVHVPIDAIDYISRWESVNYIEGGKLARPLLDESRQQTFADLVQSGNFPLPRPFTGTGINVGIVDTGLDGTHKDFFDSSGTVSRVVHTYAAPSFPPGISTDPKSDEEGHGTHVTGIAAGNGLMSSGTYTGMAPGANLFIGKTNFDTTDIVTAVDTLMRLSTVPIAVNLSFGLMTGPHDGTDDPQGSLFTKAINVLATNPPNGKGIIVAAAGNERTEKEHFQVPLPLFGSVTVQLSLETGLSFIDVWADGADRYKVTATLVGLESAAAASGTSASSSGGRISISNGVDAPLNGATHITVFFTASAPTPATIFLERIRNGGNGKVDAYIEKQNGFFTTATEAGTVTEPANAENVIAVGSFNTKIGGGAGSIGDVSTFSSLGPTRDGRIKPDLIAPGSLVYSARSFDATFLPIEIAPNNNYVIHQGTSMSAPHVAGIAALVWESNPNLSSVQIRERLKRTADPLTDGPAVPNNTWGYGKVNALRAVAEPVAAITAPPTAAPKTPVTLTSESSSGPLGAAITNYQWDAPGASVTPSGSASPTFQANAPGEYTVSLVVTSGGMASLPDTRTIHVNRIPTALVVGPSSDNVGIPVSFSGAGSNDPDSQPLTLRWLLVSRPSGSSATLVAAGSDNATMTPDFPGVYEVGLRADDGLDNSALVTKTYTTTGFAPPSSGGGGGGCSIGNGIRAEDGASSLAALLLILLPLLVLPGRKIGRRAEGTSS